VAPGGDTFSSVSNPPLNDDGQVAFTATAGGASGFFLGDGVDLVEIVRIGDTAPDGGTFSSVSNPWLNDLGQVAFNATIGFDSGIYAFTPDLQWRPPGDDNWDDNENWTLNIAPAAVHDTSIDPDTELTVIGPSSDTTVKSLTLGGGAGTASLDLGLAMITTAIGDYVQNDLSNLLIEILNETSHGGIRAAGAVTIDGALGVQPHAAFADPVVAGEVDDIVIVRGATRSGTYDQITYLGTPLVADFGPDSSGSFQDFVGSPLTGNDGLFRAVRYTASTVELRNLRAIAGDTNGDQDVDITDFNRLAVHYDPGGEHLPNPWTEGNFDGDNDVDITDFNQLAVNYAPSGYGAANEAHFIPEPTAVSLLLLGFQCFVAIRRGRKVLRRGP